MSEQLATECQLHPIDNDPNKNSIRTTLRGITQEVTMILQEAADELDLDSMYVSPQNTGSYVSERENYPELYQKALNMSAIKEAEGRYNFYTTTPMNSRTRLLKEPFMPVGEYGENSAQRLLEGVAQVVTLAESKAGSIGALAEKSSENNDAILHHTFQGVNRKNASESLLVIVQHGIIITAQILSLLSAEKVSGYEDCDKLMADLIETDVITEFSSRIGAALQPMLMRFGCFQQNPIALKDSSIGLSPEIKQLAKVNRDVSLAIAEKSREDVMEISNKIMASYVIKDLVCPQTLKDQHSHAHLLASGGATCPAANRGGDIQQTAKLITRLMPESLAA